LFVDLIKEPILRGCILPSNILLAVATGGIGGFSLRFQGFIDLCQTKPWHRAPVTGWPEACQVLTQIESWKMPVVVVFG
jgi:hypothetical protein